jgi:hypothetical protein
MSTIEVVQVERDSWDNAEINSGLFLMLCGNIAIFDTVVKMLKARKM